MAAMLHDTSDAALAAAIDANQAAQFGLPAACMGGESHDDSDALWFATGSDYTLFNGVMRARLSAARAAERIAELLAPFRARGLPMTWHVGSSSTPDDLGLQLQRHGLWRELGEPGMAASLAQLPEERRWVAGLRLLPVRDAATFGIWLEVMARGFEMPAVARDGIGLACRRFGFASDAAMRHYLGLLREEPVATSTLYLAEGVAGIYNVATLPRARRRGIGAAMTLGPLLEARNEGYGVGVLQSSKLGLNVYWQLGFRPYSRLVQYGLHPGAPYAGVPFPG